MMKNEECGMDEFLKKVDKCSDKDKDKDKDLIYLRTRLDQGQDQVRLIEYRLLGCLRSGMGYYRHYGI